MHTRHGRVCTANVTLLKGATTRPCKCCSRSCAGCLEHVLMYHPFQYQLFHSHSVRTEKTLSVHCCCTPFNATLGRHTLLLFIIHEKTKQNRGMREPAPIHMHKQVYIYLGVKNDTFFFPSETSYQVPGTRYGTWCIRSILDFNRYCGGTESTWENLGSLYCGRCHTRSSLGFNTGEYLQYSEVFQGSVRGGQPNAGSISSVRTASTASTRSTEILSACEVYSGV